jgi:hypothetical protein
MSYFTFTFREKIFSARFEEIPAAKTVYYLITDLPPSLQSLYDQDILLMEVGGNIISPGWNLADAIANGLKQYRSVDNNGADGRQVKS